MAAFFVLELEHDERQRPHGSTGVSTGKGAAGPWGSLRRASWLQGLGGKLERGRGAVGEEGRSCTASGQRQVS